MIARAKHFFAVFAAMLIIPVFVPAGTLTPPGAPAPTMKPLSDIEPRTAIRAAELPLTISAPGSYYLAETISFATQNTSAITISSDNVTIDLNGFALRGPGQATGSSGSAVLVSAGGFENIAVINGAIQNWRADGLNLANARNSRAANVTSENNGGDGIDIGLNAIVESCAALNNAGRGIICQPGTTITNSTARDNNSSGFILFDGSSTITNSTALSNGGDGIGLGEACTVSNCTANFNSGHGFNLDDGTTVTNSTAHNNTGNGIIANGGNTITNCTLLGNDANGILVGLGNRIENCTVADSGFDGIDVDSGCYVIDNICRTNGLSVSNGAGVRCADIFNRVEGNHIDANDYGIVTEAGGNLIFRNTVVASDIQNFLFTGSNIYGPIVNVAGEVSVNALTNFSF